jgi:hypothetical protein
MVTGDVSASTAEGMTDEIIQKVTKFFIEIFYVNLSLIVTR